MVTENVIDLTPRSSKTEGLFLREQGLNERLFDAASRVTRTNVIAIVGPQGGSGKTRMTFALGSALAQLAGLNVIAMDLDDDYGALLDLVPERTRTSRSLEGLVASNGNGDRRVSFPQLRACLSLTRSRMLVLRGPEETMDLDEVLVWLGNADVVILDCAAGVDRPRARWALSRADQVIVVVRPEASGSRAAAAATERALRSISANCCLVINRRRMRADVSAVEAAFSRIGQLESTIYVPESRRLAHSLEHTTYRIERTGMRTRTSIKELAATVGDQLR